MRVLSIGGDRSKRGVLFRNSPGYTRQKAYAERFGEMHIIAFSRREDGAAEMRDGALHVYPTQSLSRWKYVRDALRIAKTLPKPDVVTAQDPFEAGFAALRVARHFNVPLHVQIHTDFLSPNFAKTPLNLARLLIAGHVLRRAARIRVVSMRIQRSVEKRYRLSAPISVLPVFVDIEKVKRAEPLTKFNSFRTKLLVVSRLEKEKNIGLALRAFAQSAPQDACLIIVGEGSERTSFGVADRVFYEGMQEPAPYYAAADLVLFPSKYDGYGLVIVEALAAGKPVLSTDVGVAREAGAIVTDEAHFADALAEWFKNGPREGHLQGYPYASFDDYVAGYCSDIEACVR